MIPPWLPDWRDEEAYAIPLEKSGVALHVIAFDYLRRNPRYLCAHANFVNLPEEEQSRQVRELCRAYYIDEQWLPNPAIDPRTDEQPLPLYRLNSYPRMTIASLSAPEVTSIPIVPGETVIAFSDDLPLEMQIEAAESLLRQARTILQTANPQRLQRDIDRLLIGLRLLDARDRNEQWEEIRSLLFPNSFELSTVRKAHERAEELRDRLYQYVPKSKGSWGV